MSDVGSDYAPTDSRNARTIDTGQTFDTRSALRAQYSLFLSYHSADRAIVKSLADALQEAAELPPWFDEWDVTPGADWRPVTDSPTPCRQGARTLTEVSA